MTAHSAPVVWLRKSRDTTYKRTAKYRCGDCGIEVYKGVETCRHCGYLRRVARAKA